MTEDLFARPEWRVLVALAIGLLIGIERERHKGAGPRRAPAGLRTFGLVGFLGGLAMASGSTVLVVLAGLFTGVAIIVAYARHPTDDPGLTTEVALFATFVLGVLAQTEPLLALAAGVVVAVLLAARQPLHRFVRESLTRREINDGLIFAMAATVVLPLLPDRALDPWGVFNPFALWRLLVAMMALSALGYVAQRLLGPRLGLLAAGVAAGFVSTSAAIVTFGARTRGGNAAGPAAAGGVAAMTGSLVYLMALTAAVDPLLAHALLWPFGLALVATALYGVILAWRELRGSAAGEVLPGRAFAPALLLVFTVLVAVFAAVNTAIAGWFGTAGIVAASAAAGLADAHAAAASLAALTVSGGVSRPVAALALVTALTANMAVKVPAAIAAGTGAYAWRICGGLAVLIAGLWAGYLISTA